MQVKTYVGATPQEVMARIKEELGPDAVILSNRTFRKNGERLHEFTVGIERALADAQRSPSAADAAALARSALAGARAAAQKKPASPGGKPAARTARGGAAAYAEAGAGLGAPRGAGPAPHASSDAHGLAQIPFSSPPGWNEWHKEWVQIKDHLFALMKPNIQLELLSPRQRVALEYLQREGVADSVSVELYRRLRANTDSSVLEVLSEMVCVRTWGTEQWPERVHVMAGPFGAGKTPAGLRMALALRREQPDARIAFVNADCQRGNGRLVLRHWAELSDFSYLEVHDPQSMAKALTASADALRVFVDLQGLRRDSTLLESLSALGLHGGSSGTRAPTGGLAVHLVLSPHHDSQQGGELLERYRPAPEMSASLVCTKLDESMSFGALPNLAVQCGLPISALSFGAGLRDSLMPATEPLVWRLIFKRQLPGPAGSASA